MIVPTSSLIRQVSDPVLVDDWLRRGIDGERDALADANADWLSVRGQFGFTSVTPLLTPPSANLKLDKGYVPSFGFTGQHYVMRLPDGMTINSCPWAGHCTKVCVLDNGNGRYDSVQRSRRARMTFMVRHTESFFTLLGFELGRAVGKYGRILFRPDVNTDLAWHEFAPTLWDGSLFGDGLDGYGYTKDRSVLLGDGWLAPHLRVSYSWNETSSALLDRVGSFVGRGGSVAVVTNRKPKSEVSQWSDIGRVVDADKTDEWMFEPGVIGDLSAKGKARDLIGKSDFVMRLDAYSSVPVTIS